MSVIKIIKKTLFNNCGESLIEALAAIVIVVLAGLLLLPLFSTSVKVNEAAKSEDLRYYNELCAAEQLENDKTLEGELKITVTADGKWRNASGSYYNAAIFGRSFDVDVEYHFFDGDGDGEYGNELITYTVLGVGE